MIKEWFKNFKKHFVNWWNNFKQKKLNIGLLISGTAFVVFALLSWVVPQLSVVAFLFLIAAVVMIAYYYQKMHKENKRRFLVAMYKARLNEKEIKIVKRQLRSLKIMFIVLYLIALSLTATVLQSLNIF